TLSVIYLATADGAPIGGDDAAEARVFSSSTVPHDLAFDHAKILADYFLYRATGERPKPDPSDGRPLGPKERAYLLGVARAAIIAAIEGSEANGPSSPGGIVDENAGAFVSLHREGELRGCIGSFARDRPLREVVHDMALAAAFEDPRFPPLTASEVD